MRMDLSTIGRSTIHTMNDTLLAIYHHGSYYYHHQLMAIPLLNGVQQNVYPGLDTPPKHDASPSYPIAR
jgi:hypothetical protein